MTILVTDEQLHPTEPIPHWQESFYFNWTDLEAQAFGLTRIGYRLDSGEADAVLIAVRGGKRELVYAAQKQPVATSPDAFDPAAGLKIDRMTYTCEEPLKRWRLQLEGKDSVDLTWTALSQPYDFDHDGDGSPQVIAARHFEHPGTVTGTVTIGGKEHVVNGFGTRDKSWGARDWDGISGWDWISAQFGPELAFTAAQATVDGVQSQSGFVYADGECTAIASFQLDYTWGSAEHVPAWAEIAITTVDGVTRTFSARERAQVPLFKSGLLLQETHAAFTARGKDGKALHGSGVLEHAFHGGTTGALLRLPKLLPVMKDALITRFK